MGSTHTQCLNLSQAASSLFLILLNSNLPQVGGHGAQGYSSLQALVKSFPRSQGLKTLENEICLRNHLVARTHWSFPQREDDAQERVLGATSHFSPSLLYFLSSVGEAQLQETAPQNNFSRTSPSSARSRFLHMGAPKVSSPGQSLHKKEVNGVVYISKGCYLGSERFPKQAGWLLVVARSCGAWVMSPGQQAAESRG